MVQLFPPDQGGRTDAYARAYVALGSNIGNREELLEKAVFALDAHPHIRVARLSAIYETDPVGYTDQPPFLNMVIAVETSLEPTNLLRELLACEERLGRVRQIRWGPRTIDLDLLLYDNVRMEDVDLILPHPRMLERAFVLVPLNDVLERGHPLQLKVEAAAKSALQDGKEGISLWKTTNWHSALERSES